MNQYSTRAARTWPLRVLLVAGAVFATLIAPSGASARPSNSNHHHQHQVSVSHSHGVTISQHHGSASHHSSARLANLNGFSWHATGTTWIFDEGFDPNDVRTLANTYTLNGQYSIGAGNTDSARLQYVRTSLGTPRSITELINGSHGVLSGVDSNNGAAADKAMTSDRLAAVLKEQWLLNPQILLKDVSTGHRRATKGRHGKHHDSTQVLVLHNGGAPIRIVFDRRTNQVWSVSTVEHHSLRRDIGIRVDFSNWHRVQGMNWPMHVELRIDGHLMHVEDRSNVTLNPAFAAGTFTLPAVTPAPTHDPSLADRGMRTSQWLMMFANLGFPKDGDHSIVTPVQASPGVWLIQGHPNQSAVVEQSDGLVVLDAALDEVRSEAIIAWAATTFPNKPIKAIHVGHHHLDHSGGTRPYVALGAKLYVHKSAKMLFRQVLNDRSSTVLPDRLDGMHSLRAKIVAVPEEGEVVLSDSLRPIRFFSEPTTHASSTIVAYVGGDNTVFVNGDTCSMGAGPGQGGAGCRSLNDTLVAHGIAPAVFVGGHGPVKSGAAFLASLPAG